jgi:hypothetical protein
MRTIGLLGLILALAAPAVGCAAADGGADTDYDDLQIFGGFYGRWPQNGIDMLGYELPYSGSDRKDPRNGTPWPKLGEGVFNDLYNYGIAPLRSYRGKCPVTKGATFDLISTEVAHNKRIGMDQVQGGRLALRFGSKTRAFTFGDKVMVPVRIYNGYGVETTGTARIEFVGYGHREGHDFWMWDVYDVSLCFDEKAYAGFYRLGDVILGGMMNHVDDDSEQPQQLDGVAQLFTVPIDDKRSVASLGGKAIAYTYMPTKFFSWETHLDLETTSGLSIDSTEMAHLLIRAIGNAATVHHPADTSYRNLTNFATRSGQRIYGFAVDGRGGRLKYQGPVETVMGPEPVHALAPSAEELSGDYGAIMGNVKALGVDPSVEMAARPYDLGHGRSLHRLEEYLASSDNRNKFAYATQMEKAVSRARVGRHGGPFYDQVQALKSLTARAPLAMPAQISVIVTNLDDALPGGAGPVGPFSGDKCDLMQLTTSCGFFITPSGVPMEQPAASPFRISTCGNGICSPEFHEDPITCSVDC